ncbi:MAG: hypothetical protein ACRD27_00335 [Terracidiphilus sp.]
MRQKQTAGNWGRRGCAFVAVFCSLAAVAATAQQSPATQQTSKGAQSNPAPGVQSSPAPASPAPATGSAAPATHITPEQAKQLFASVDEIMKFASDDSGLPIESPVKRQLTSRAAVEQYLETKFDSDQDSKRLERDEIVLKKFGLLDRDFELKPFLLALLREQIEAYYDTKTKTVNLLDWVQPDEQKPVLAHELTHALQDQHSDLEKWDNQTPDDVSTTAAGDQVNLAKDEMDTARDAVAEGQATAVMMDYVLKPLGKSLIKDPEVIDIVRKHMTASSDSPVMARAPLLLSESMLFPYRDGLSFEQDIWMDEGQTAAFAGTLDRPPTSSWEIINPLDYERKLIPPVPLLPDIHPLVDKLYRPYDIGQVGQLDVKILSQIFGGDETSRDLTSAWDGGLYWAGQLRSAATPAERDSTKSLALFYLSISRNPASAQEFTRMYADNLGRKYLSVKPDEAAQSSASAEEGDVEQDFITEEGPVLITTRGNMVFVAESFPFDMARKLTSLILDAQGGGAMQMTQLAPPAWLFAPQAHPTAVPASQLGEPLSAGFVRFFSNCGVMKAVVDAKMDAATRLRPAVSENQTR